MCFLCVLTQAQHRLHVTRQRTDAKKSRITRAKKRLSFAVRTTTNYPFLQGWRNQRQSAASVCVQHKTPKHRSDGRSTKSCFVHEKNMQPFSYRNPEANPKKLHIHHFFQETICHPRLVDGVVRAAGPQDHRQLGLAGALGFILRPDSAGLIPTPTRDEGNGGAPKRTAEPSEL